MKRILETLTHEYIHLYPKEVASYLDTLSIKDSSNIVAALEGTDIAKIISHSNFSKALIWINQLSEPALIKLFNALSNDLCPLLLRRVDKMTRSIIMEHLPESKKRYLKKNFDFPAHAIGSFTDPVILTINEEKTVGDALSLIQDALDYQHDCLYVVDHNQRLAGLMTLREFIRNSAEQKIAAVMQKPSLILHASAYKANYIERITKHEREEIPVVDANKRLVGIIRKSLISQLSDETVSNSKEPPLGIFMSFAELFWQITGSMLPLPNSTDANKNPPGNL